MCRYRNRNELFYYGRTVMKVEGRRPLETQEVQLRAQKPGKQETTPGVSENPQAGQ